MSTPRRRLPTQAYVYLVLALFNVLSAVAGLALCGHLVSTLRSATATNEQWASRLDALADLGRIAGDANAPGNDVFESKDVKGEEAKKNAAKAEFDVAFAKAKAEAAQVGPLLVEPVAAAGKAFARMDAVADRIFSAFREGDEAKAGKSMAEMDQAFADVRAALAQARVVAVGQQRLALAAQGQVAVNVQRLQLLLAILLGVVILGVTGYGMRLAFEFARAQATVAQQKDDLRLVFDAVAQGFVTLDATGAIVAERSRVVDEWLGAPRPGESLADLLARHDPKTADWFSMSFAALVEDVLPIEMCLDQMPTRLVVPGEDAPRTLRIEYRPLLASGRLHKLVVVLSDISAEEERRRAGAEQAELLAIFERINADKDGFLEFFGDSTQMVQAIADGTERPEVEQRLLHTLKGNCGVWGQEAMARRCHEVENVIAEYGALGAADREAFRACWQAFAAKVRKLVGEPERAGRIAIEDREFAAVVRAILTESPSEEVLAQMLRWKNESTSARLGRLAEQARSTVERLERGAVEIVVDVAPGAARLPQGEWQGFFGALVHTVRNAVDHGIEPADERAALGKGKARLVLRAAIERGGAFVVEVTDDGRGIDWSRLREKARQRGVAVDGFDEIGLLSLQGLSSRDEITELSGRGVGVGAVKVACEAHGGVMTVTSRRGVGTTFRFEFPASRAEESGVHALALAHAAGF